MINLIKETKRLMLCPKCKGRGVEIELRVRGKIHDQNYSTYEVCEYCEGTGRVYEIERTVHEPFSEELFKEDMTTVYTDKPVNLKL